MGSNDIFGSTKKYAETKDYDQRDQKKYWRFFLSGENQDYSRYGLVDFIRDCF